MNIVQLYSVREPCFQGFPLEVATWYVCYAFICVFICVSIVFLIIALVLNIVDFSKPAIVRSSPSFVLNISRSGSEVSLWKPFMRSSIPQDCASSILAPQTSSLKWQVNSCLAGSQNMKYLKFLTCELLSELWVDIKPVLVSSWP